MHCLPGFLWEQPHYAAKDPQIHLVPGAFALQSQLKCHLPRSPHDHRHLNSDARSHPRHSHCTPNLIQSKNNANHRMSLRKPEF